MYSVYLQLMKGRKQMNESPCKQCISFAICKVQIKGMKSPNVTQFSAMRNCEILKEYVYMDHPGAGMRIDSARIALGLGALYV